MLLNNKANPCDSMLESEISRSLPEPLKQAYQSPEEKTEKENLILIQLPRHPQSGILLTGLRRPE